MNQQYTKAQFCKKFIDESGLFPSNRRPVWYNEDNGYYGKTTRVFVNADWFPTWEEWKPRAEKAMEAASMQYDAYNEFFEKRGCSFPIVGSPQYLLERDSIQPSGFSIWVNALCPDRHEFQRVVSEAKQRIEDQGKPLDSVRVAEFGAPLPLLPVPSSEFQDEPSNPDVADLIETL